MSPTTCSAASNSFDEICDDFFTDLLLDLADDTSNFLLEFWYGSGIVFINLRFHKPLKEEVAWCQVT